MFQAVKKYFGSLQIKMLLQSVDDNNREMVANALADLLDAENYSRVNVVQRYGIRYEVMMPSIMQYIWSMNRAVLIINNGARLSSDWVTLTKTQVSLREFYSDGDSHLNIKEALQVFIDSFKIFSQLVAKLRTKQDDDSKYNLLQIKRLYASAIEIIIQFARTI